MTNNMKTLVERYTEILADLDESYLDGTACRKKMLSMPFLVSDLEESSAPRIMVIGRECGWNWRVPYQGGGAAAYVPAALAEHRKRFGNWMKRQKRGATFFGFMQALAGHLGNESSKGLIYSNLFCFDYAGGDPRQSLDHYEQVVQPYSAKLLKAQIEHFQPDLIIFANGVDSRNVRKVFFPHEPGVVQGLRWSGLPQEIPDHQLWEFQLYGKYRCLRIHHPSAYGKPARAARDYIVRHLTQLLLRKG